MRAVQIISYRIESTLIFKMFESFRMKDTSKQLIKADKNVLIFFILAHFVDHVESTLKYSVKDLGYVLCY